MIAPAVAFSSVWRSLQRRIRRRQFQRSPNGISANPASPGRVVLVHESLLRSHGQADSAASHEVSCPSAPAHRAALSGAAGLRTIPLRLLGWFLSGSTGSVSATDGTDQLALAVFRSFIRIRSSLDEGMRCLLAAGHASRLSCLIPRCSATRKMRGRSRLRRNPSVPATLVGFGPFAVLFLHRRFRSVSARLSPHAVNELPPRLFFRGTGRLIPLTF